MRKLQFQFLKKATLSVLRVLQIGYNAMNRKSGKKMNGKIYKFHVL